MSANLRTRVNAQSIDTYGSGITQRITLADFVSLNLNLLKTGTPDYQQVLITETLATETGTNYDLNDASNTLEDAGGNAIQFAKIFWLLLAIDTPEAGVGVRFGPQGITNAAQLWFSGVTADEWQFVPDCLLYVNRIAGLTVDSANANVRIYNPSASVACTYRLWIVGEKPSA